MQDTMLNAHRVRVCTLNFGKGGGDRKRAGNESGPENVSAGN